MPPTITTITDPVKFCINCVHAVQPSPFGSFYCAISERDVDLVTGKPQFGMCEVERGFIGPCGPHAQRFTAASDNFIRRTFSA